MSSPAYVERPLTSQLSCRGGEVAPGTTARELDLQQQRRCVLNRAGGQPEGGYLAICLAVKSACMLMMTDDEALMPGQP